MYVVASHELRKKFCFDDLFQILISPIQLLPIQGLLDFVVFIVPILFWGESVKYSCNECE